MVFADEDRWIKFCFELSDLGYPATVSVVTDGLSDDAKGESFSDSSV